MPTDVHAGTTASLEPPPYFARRVGAYRHTTRLGQPGRNLHTRRRCDGPRHAPVATTDGDRSETLSRDRKPHASLRTRLPARCRSRSGLHALRPKTTTVLWSGRHDDAVEWSDRPLRRPQRPVAADECLYANLQPIEPRGTRQLWLLIVGYATRGLDAANGTSDVPADRQPEQLRQRDVHQDRGRLADADVPALPRCGHVRVPEGGQPGRVRRREQAVDDLLDGH